MQLPTLVCDGEVQVIVIPSGDRGGVVHAASVVGAPSFGRPLYGPDRPLPDEVFDTECLRVGLHPVGDFPAQVEGSSLGGDADGVAEGSVARAAQGVLGGLAGAGGGAELGRASCRARVGQYV